MQLADFPVSFEGMLLTADLLFHYQRCDRRAFLEVCGDIAQRDPPSDYVLKLIQDSAANRRAVLATESYEQPRYPKGDWFAGAEATLALMRRGVDRIVRGVLLTETEDGVTLVSDPDVLMKQPGRSDFGNWLYVPADIRLGKRPKQEYQIVTAFHVQVLAAVQGGWPETAWLVLREKGWHEVDLWTMLPRLQTVLADCMTMLAAASAPEVFISRNRCSLCHWFSHCYAIAQTQQHLSLLPGVTPSRYQHLQDLNLTTVAAIASASPEALTPLPGFGEEVAAKLVRQARSTLRNQAIATPYDPPLPPHEVPTASVELYFDIESEPDLDLIYLHGVLVVDRQAETETFHCLLAENAEAEEAIWHQFLDLVWTYPTAPIFHFCTYELQTVKRLAQQYGTSDQRLRPLLPRFVDLHERVTRLVSLPIENYALKSIARWLGFDWRDSDANGAQSVYWYAQWLKTHDRTFLDAIVRYNEDDCRATHCLKEWLAEFLHVAPQPDFLLGRYNVPASVSSHQS